MEVLDLGLKSYQEVWSLQKELVQKKIEDPSHPDVLILTEHLPVYTFGRAEKTSSTPANIYVPKLGDVPTFEIERGGRITFHGPGQLVGYPIFSIRHKDLRRWLRDLEKTLVNVLNEHTLLNVKPFPETLLLEPGQLQTGVWVRDKKIASIGIAVKHWISYHGFSLNLTTDLRYFNAVEPCGFAGSIMTNLKKELGLESTSNSSDMTEVIREVKASLIKSFMDLSKAYTSIKDQNEKTISDHPLETEA